MLCFVVKSGARGLSVPCGRCLQGVKQVGIPLIPQAAVTASVPLASPNLDFGIWLPSSPPCNVHKPRGRSSRGIRCSNDFQVS